MKQWITILSLMLGAVGFAFGGITWQISREDQIRKTYATKEALTDVEGHVEQMTTIGVNLQVQMASIRERIDMVEKGIEYLVEQERRAHGTSR